MLYRRPRVSVLAAVVQTQTANIQVRRFASQDLSPGFLSVKNVQFVIKLKSISHCNGHIISKYKKKEKNLLLKFPQVDRGQVLWDRGARPHPPLLLCDDPRGRLVRSFFASSQEKEDQLAKFCYFLKKEFFGKPLFSLFSSGLKRSLSSWTAFTTSIESSLWFSSLKLASSSLRWASLPTLATPGKLIVFYPKNFLDIWTSQVLARLCHRWCLSYQLRCQPSWWSINISLYR